jgi:hypothetical protein
MKIALAGAAALWALAASIEPGSGRCRGTTFPASSISRNFAGAASPASRRDGLLVAEIR